MNTINLLINPFTFRPGPAADTDKDGEIADWEDNALSNSLAWASTVFTPMWCQSDTHWTAKFATHLWTSCPCCMVFRGITIGAVLTTALWLISISSFVLLSR